MPLLLVSSRRQSPTWIFDVCWCLDGWYLHCFRGEEGRIQKLVQGMVREGEQHLMHERDGSCSSLRKNRLFLRENVKKKPQYPAGSHQVHFELLAGKAIRKRDKS